MKRSIQLFSITDISLAYLCEDVGVLLQLSQQLENLLFIFGFLTIESSIILGINNDRIGLTVSTVFTKARMRLVVAVMIDSGSVILAHGS